MIRYFQQSVIDKFQCPISDLQAYYIYNGSL